MKKSLFLFSAIAFGILLPQGHSYAFLIRYFIMLILFCSLLDVEIEPRSALNPRLGIILAMMMAIAGLTAWISNWFDPDLALVAFVVAMTPTAAAAPVMTRFLDGRVDYVMSSVVVTSSFSALVLPLVVPVLRPGEQANIDIISLLSTLSVVLVPLLIAQGLRRYAPQVARTIDPLKGAGFYFWMGAIYLATAKATHFITVESTSSWQVIVEIAAISLGICAINFSTGQWLGGREWGQEMGQSLGQKNTLLGIWISLTFLTPAIALGPMFYIVFQNLYNSYLLARDSAGESG